MRSRTVTEFAAVLASSLAAVAVLLPSCSGGGGGEAIVPEARLVGASAVSLLETGVRTGRSLPFTGPGLRGYRTTSLAYDTHANQLWALAPEEGVVVAIDRTSGAGVAAYGNPLSECEQIAYDPERRRLVAAWNGERAWFRPTSGVVTDVEDFVGATLGDIAYDAVTKTWYQVATGSLWTFDFEVGERDEIVAATTVTSLHSAAIDPDARLLYGIDVDEDLVAVHLDTGAVTEIGATGLDNVHGLAFDTEEGVLWALEFNDGQLARIDPATANSTVVSVFSRPRVTGAVQDPVSGSFWAVDAWEDRLLLVDPVTARSVLVGSLSATDVQGLAYDTTTSRLFGIDRGTQNLIEIDPLTAAVTVIGDTGFANVESLAYRPADDTLYGISNATRELVAIDTTTGAGTAVALLSLFSTSGLTVDPVSGDLVTHRKISQTAFHRIDPDTYALTAFTADVGSAFEAFCFDESTGVLLAFSDGTGDLVEIDPALDPPLVRGRIGALISAAAHDRGEDLVFVFALSYGLLHTLDGDSYERVNSVELSDFVNVEALAFDQDADLLYGMDDDGELWILDPATGDATFVGDSGIDTLALAFHQEEGVLHAYARNGSDDELWVVDPGTASASFVGEPFDPDRPGDAISFGGLTYDPVAGRLYGVTYDRRLYRVDPATAECTLVARAGGELSALGGRAR